MELCMQNREYAKSQMGPKVVIGGRVKYSKLLTTNNNLGKNTRWGSKLGSKQGTKKVTNKSTDGELQVQGQLK